MSACITSSLPCIASANDGRPAGSRSARSIFATAIAEAVMTTGLLRSPVPETIGKRDPACLRSPATITRPGASHGFRRIPTGRLGHPVPGRQCARCCGFVQLAVDWKGRRGGSVGVLCAAVAKLSRKTICRVARNPATGRLAVIVGGLAINRFTPTCQTWWAPTAWTPDAQAAVAWPPICFVGGHRGAGGLVCGRARTDACHRRRDAGVKPAR